MNLNFSSGVWKVVIEAIGWLGVVAAIVSFQSKKHNKVMFFRTLHELLFAVQYLLLGAYTGAAMNLIGCIRNTTFSRMVEKNKNTMWARWLFSIITLIFIAVTWEGPKSILSGVAKIVSTFAYGSSNTGLIRILIFFTSISWLLYNYLVKSYSGVAAEVFTIISIIVGIVRLDIKHSQKKEITAQ